MRPEGPSIHPAKASASESEPYRKVSALKASAFLPAPNSTSYARHHRVITISFFSSVRLDLLRVAAASTSFDSSAYAQSGLLLCQGARPGLLPSAQSPVAARACLMRASVTVRMMASS